MSVLRLICLGLGFTLVYGLDVAKVLRLCSWVMLSGLQMKVLGNWRCALGEEEGSSQGCHQRGNTQLPLLLPLASSVICHALVMIPSIRH